MEGYLILFWKMGRMLERKIVHNLGKEFLCLDYTNRIFAS